MNQALRTLPENPSLEQYKKQAKELVKAHGEGDPVAAARIRQFLPRAARLDAERILNERFSLSDAQLVLAREHAFESWPKMKHRIETLRAEEGDLEAQLETFKSAIEMGDADELRRLFQRFPKLKERIAEPLFDFGKPAIVAAKDHRELVAALLEHGADINARSVWERGSYGVLDDTAADVAEYLIEKGARVDIHAAAGLGKLELVEKLVSSDPSLVHARGPDGKLPLHCAATTAMVDFLLDGGAEIDARDVDHVATAAQYLIKNQDVLRRLVERGAELDIFMAAALGDIALIDRALERAPQTLHAHAPCMVSEESDYSGYFYPKLPEGSAHIYTWSLGFGWSPAYTAWRLGHRDGCDYLLTKLPPAVRLAEACARLDAECMEALARTCPPDERALDERTADLVAGRSLMIRNFRTATHVTDSLALYLKAGFAPSAPCYWGFTPLHWAAWLGHAEAVRMLLEAGASVHIKGRVVEGTPLGAALHGCFDPHPDYGQYREVFELLVDHGATVDPAWLPTQDAVVTRILERAVRRG